MPLQQRDIVFYILILAVAISAIWLMVEPGFEPALALIGFAATLCSTFWFKPTSTFTRKKSTGKISFDYSNNNGTYTIGADKQRFDLSFSKASDTSIHIYNDPPSISGVALATDAKTIEQVTDASIYDMSSRSRTPQEGEVVVLRNIHNNYAAALILDVKDRTRQDMVDEITLKYTINPEGCTDFS